MMDIVKGSLFNMLEVLDGIGERVLDLFAGSGSLGIEALSRGTEHADFVEQNREACQLITENLQRLRLANQGRVVTQSVLTFLSAVPSRSHFTTASVPYDLVFIDAPYANKVSVAVLTLLTAQPWLTDEAYVCVGHHKYEALPEQCETLRRMKYRCFGASCLSIYQKQNTPAYDSGFISSDVRSDSQRSY